MASPPTSQAQSARSAEHDFAHDAQFAYDSQQAADEYRQYYEPGQDAPPQEYNDYVNLLFKESPGMEPTGEPLDAPASGNGEKGQGRGAPMGYYAAHPGYYNGYYGGEGGYPPHMMYAQHMYPEYGYYAGVPNGSQSEYEGCEGGVMPPGAFSALVYAQEGDDENPPSEGEEGEAHTQLLAKRAAQQALPLDLDADGDDGEALYRQMEHLTLEHYPPRGYRQPPYFPQANPYPPQRRSWADLVKDGQGGAPGSPVPPMSPQGFPPMAMMMGGHAGSMMPLNGMPYFPAPQPQQGKMRYGAPGQPMGGHNAYPPRGGRGGRGRGSGRGGRYHNNNGYGNRGAYRTREQAEGDDGLYGGYGSPSTGSGSGGGAAHRRRGMRDGLPMQPDMVGMEHLQEVNPEGEVQVPPQARFFVIKSYNEDDVHKAVKARRGLDYFLFSAPHTAQYQIWTSTENGNKRLDRAFKEQSLIAPPAPIYLFYSVNASGKFCGVAEMTSAVDHAAKSNVWNQTDKWTGQFSIKWLYIKDVPNGNFRHIRLANNDNKPVTNSRDTQEVPNKQGREVLRIFAQYALRSSLLDDWEYYEQGEESQKAKLEKKSEQQVDSAPRVDAEPVVGQQ